MSLSNNIRIDCHNFVKVVTQAEYEEWLKGAIEEYAGVPQPFQVASN